MIDAIPTPQGSVPGTAICRPLFIPADPQWLSIVTGALSHTTNPKNYEQFPGGLAPDVVAQRFEQMLTEYLAGNCMPPEPFYPEQANLFALDGRRNAGNPVLTIQPGGVSGFPTTAHPFAHFVRLNAPAFLDWIEWGFLLQSGTYTFRVIHARTTDGGLMNFKLNGITNIGDVQFYNPTAVVNLAPTFGPINIPVAGLQILRGTIQSQASFPTRRQQYLTSVHINPVG